MQPTEKRQKLSDIVVSIELTLLSVIQGIALNFLIVGALGVFPALDYVHWIYPVMGFMILIAFWAQALVHVLSFISWPLDFKHNFLYFIVIIAEVFVFSSMTNPLQWFITNAVFFFSAEILYYADIKLLATKKQFFTTEKQIEFYGMNLRDQKLAFNYFVPIGFVFSVVSALLIWDYPTFFIQNNGHLYLAAIQAITGIAALSYLLPLFRKHIAHIEFI